MSYAHVFSGIYTPARCGGTHIALVEEGVEAPFLALHDEPTAHDSIGPTTWWRLDWPAGKSPDEFGVWLDHQVFDALRVHREPWNQMRGADLPDCAAADYFA